VKPYPGSVKNFQLSFFVIFVEQELKVFGFARGNKKL